MSRLVVTSRVSKKNIIVMSIAVSILSIMTLFTGYKWIKFQIYQPLEVMFEVGILIACIGRMSGKYSYEMGDKSLKFMKNGWFGSLTKEVLYPNILGIYRYQPKLLDIMKFHHTYRLHSALDGRDVLTLAYTTFDRRGKKENCRIYFKPGECLLKALHDQLPNKVMISEQQVILQDLKNS